MANRSSVNILGLLNFQERQQRTSDNKITGLMEMFSNQAVENEDFDGAIENINKLQGKSGFTKQVGDIYKENLSIKKDNIEKFNTLWGKFDTIEKDIKTIEPNNKSEWLDMKDDLLSSAYNVSVGVNRSRQSQLVEKLKSLENMRVEAERQYDTAILSNVIQNSTNPAQQSTPSQKANASTLDLTTSAQPQEYKQMLNSNVYSVKELKSAQDASVKSYLETKATPNKYAGYDPAEVRGVLSETSSFINRLTALKGFQKDKKNVPSLGFNPILIPSSNVFSNIATTPQGSGDSDPLAVGYEDVTRALISILPTKDEINWGSLKPTMTEGKFAYKDSSGNLIDSHLKDKRGRFDSQGRTRLEWTKAYYNYAKNQMDTTSLFKQNKTGDEALIEKRLKGDYSERAIQGIAETSSDFYYQPLQILRKMDNLIKTKNKPIKTYDTYNTIKAYRSGD